MYNVECLYREIDAVSVCHRRFFCQHIDVGQIFEIDVTLPLNYYYTYSTHTKFGNTASVFPGFNTAAYGPTCLQFFRDNSC